MVTKSLHAPTRLPALVAHRRKRRLVTDANARLWMIAILALSDVTSLLLAILVAMQFRPVPGLLFNPAYYPIVLLLGAMLVSGFSATGLYPGIGLHYADELRSIVSNTSFAFVLVTGVTFLLQTSIIYSRLILILSWMLCLVFVPTSRYILRTWLAQRNLWGEPVVIVGDAIKALPLAEHFIKNPQFGINPLEVLPDEYTTDPEANLVVSLHKVAEYAQRFAVRTALVVASDLNTLDHLADRYRFVFRRVILIKEQNGKFGLNSLAPLDFDTVLGLQVKNNLLSPSSQVIKRAIDIAASSLGLVLLTPILASIALCIVLFSPGRVFYRQKRLGKSGAGFTMLKFRTMHLNADRVLHAELERNPALKYEWEHYQKLKHDPRITNIGRLLRKYSLDELPQLWNVLKGEMSLVGPRPILPSQREKYGRTLREYERVRPGMTGLWQVSGRNGTSFARRAELDDEYIQRWSVWLDVFILLKTVKVVFWRHDAY